jgi:outer membrane lipoprotein-sorting protein
MMNIRPIAFALCLLCLSSPAYAVDEHAPEGQFLTPAAVARHEELVHRLEHYLSDLTTIAADFSQVAPDGSLTNGKFYLERPGRMRWQYNPPTPILMVADGKVLTYYDYELEQVNYIPLDSTLIGFLAEPQISFSGYVGLRTIEEQNDAIRVTIAERGKPGDGELMLEFSDKPLTLRNMVVTDATHQVTSVSLNNAQFGVKLDRELFVFRDPRKPRQK